MPAASDPSRGLSGASPGDPTTLVQRPTALTSADLRHGLLARDRIRSPTHPISPLVALTQMGEIGAPPWVISSAEGTISQLCHLEIAAKMLSANCTNII